MVIRVCAFTKQGRQTTEKLIEKMPSLHLKWREDEPLQEWTGEAFADHQPILYVGACGIAVRAIAPFVQDKLTDSPVLVMDEKGKHIIPLLSGHIGGANELQAGRSDRGRTGADNGDRCESYICG